MTLIDPLGKILTEIRSDATVATLTTRVRGGEPAPGDALGAGHYQRFVVLTNLGHSRLKRSPVQEVRLLAKCYGSTHQDAALLAGAVSDAIHAKGHRLTAGVSIFGSFDDGGDGASRDPDTDQPYEAVVISVGASTELII